MERRIKFGLSQKEIKAAQKQLRDYQKEITQKCRLLVSELSDIGLKSVEAVLQQHIDSGQTIGSLRIEENSSGQIIRMAVVVESDAILFLEFGAGITYSGTQNPKAGELGYGPGTYPGKGHWNDPNGWWYPDENGEYHHTFGTKASMPMYKASVKMRQSVFKVAKNIFK